MQWHWIAIARRVESFNLIFVNSISRGFIYEDVAPAASFTDRRVFTRAAFAFFCGGGCVIISMIWADF